MRGRFLTWYINRELLIVETSACLDSVLFLILYYS
ncbi:hypothetical protein EVA_19448 [gut metagenome]|uniref:Uncharacterized protein n=1 Tax=gut metagenome TaxID=749906 RepID=J9FC28_9ZZZZ